MYIYNIPKYRYTYLCIHIHQVLRILVESDLTSISLYLFPYYNKS